MELNSPDAVKLKQVAINSEIQQMQKKKEKRKQKKRKGKGKKRPSNPKRSFFQRGLTKRTHFWSRYYYYHHIITTPQTA